MRRPGPTVDDRATIFEDQITAGTWRFEKKSADGRYEIRIFTGRAARERAIRYAARNDATFDVMRLKPHRRRLDLVAQLAGETATDHQRIRQSHCHPARGEEREGLV